MSIQECVRTEVESINTIVEQLNELIQQPKIDPRLLFQKAFMLRIVAMNLDSISKIGLQQVLDEVFSEREVQLDWDQIMKDLNDPNERRNNEND